ncbi:MAG: hypothetical protein AAF703_06810 [Cyanobacteria bacterium P01_D01_bin.105]
MQQTQDADNIPENGRYEAAALIPNKTAADNIAPDQMAANQTATNQTAASFTEHSNCVETHETPLLFSAQFKRRTSQRLIWLIWLCFSLGPVILGRLVQILPTPGMQWIGYGCGVIGLLSLYFYIIDTVPIWGYSKLIAKFAQRLSAEGFKPDEGTFVGLAPSAGLRNYNNHTIWDMGWLHLAGNQLYYIGEQLRFTLNTHQVTHLELQKDATSLIGTYAVVIMWQGPAIKSKNFAERDFNHQTFRLQPIQAPSLAQLKPLSQALRHQLEDWQIGRGVDELTEKSARDRLQSLQLPEFGEVDSRPFPTLSIGLVIAVWANLMMLAFAIALVTGSLAINRVLTGFIFTMATLGAALQLWPLIPRPRSSIS